MRKLYIVLSMCCIATGAYAQSAIDAYRFSQPDLRGTARFMGMGGAFGALGGDLSTLSQNPAGIGVYRSNEIGFTLDLDAQKSTSDAFGLRTSNNQTKFYLDNIGGVATLKIGSDVVPNINLGFTYNKAVSFNRRYRGSIPQLQTSMSNYIAGIANGNELTVADVTSIKNQYDPYNPNDGGIQAPWLAILGYDSYLINPNGDPANPSWTGQFGTGTAGVANFDVTEKGSVDEYNIAIGGNISNVVYWGMNFDIVNFDYKLDANYGEELSGAYVDNPAENTVVQADSRWRMRNLYRANGTGFNYQLGVIVKPIQELRLGFAFHTPTWYSLTETYSANINAQYFGNNVNAETNNGYPGTQDYNFNSPWKIIASAAGVIGGKFIISADYEWNGYKTMKFSEASNYYGGGYWDDPWGYDYYSATPAAYNNDPYQYENQDIKDIYRHTDTFRVGAEYRVTPSFSVRAGYSHVSSPVESKAKNNGMTIYTAGTIPNYRFDNDTNYITCGLGYRHKGFYVDLAYVYKHMTSEYHAFTPDPTSEYASPAAKLTFNNSRIVLSTGFKF